MTIILSQQRHGYDVREKQHDDDQLPEGYFFIEEKSDRYGNGKGNEHDHRKISERHPDHSPVIEPLKQAEKLFVICKSDGYHFLLFSAKTLEGHDQTAEIGIYAIDEEAENGNRQHTENKQLHPKRIFVFIPFDLRKGIGSVHAVLLN